MIVATKQVTTPEARPLSQTAAREGVEGDIRSQASSAKIMVVDDDFANVQTVRRFLERGGYTRFVTTTDSTTAMDTMRKRHPDVVLLDLMMPVVSGLDILAEMQFDDDLAFTPIIIFASVSDQDTKLRALELGATDFLAKPLDASELVARVRNVLAVKAYQDQLRNYSKDLEAAVRARTAELEASRQDVIHCLARAAEFRDDDTGYHIVRVGKYARLLGEALGITGERADVLEQAAQLHDVGKIGIPDAVLLKPGKLTAEEFDIMKTHCGFGHHILNPISNEDEEILRRHALVGAKILEVGTSPVLMLAEKIALTHHEWWDGSGYPAGLAGKRIPLEGRITAVADVFDALGSPRCYKSALPLEECFEIMAGERGTHFDPQVLDAFFELREEVAEIQGRFVEV
jgi:putative two-component system response regulator